MDRQMFARHLLEFPYLTDVFRVQRRVFEQKQHSVVCHDVACKSYTLAQLAAGQLKLSLDMTMMSNIGNQFAEHIDNGRIVVCATAIDNHVERLIRRQPVPPDQTFLERYEI